MEFAPFRDQKFDGVHLLLRPKPPSSGQRRSHLVDESLEPSTEKLSQVALTTQNSFLKFVSCYKKAKSTYQPAMDRRSARDKRARWSLGLMFAARLLARGAVGGGPVTKFIRGAELSVASLLGHRATWPCSHSPLSPSRSR